MNEDVPALISRLCFIMERSGTFETSFPESPKEMKVSHDGLGIVARRLTSESWHYFLVKSAASSVILGRVDEPLRVYLNGEAEKRIAEMFVTLVNRANDAKEAARRDKKEADIGFLRVFVEQRDPLGGVE